MFSVSCLRFNTQPVISKMHLLGFRKSLTGFSRHSRLPLFLLVLVGITMPSVQAEIPEAAVTDPLFAKGYLNVVHYGVIPSNSAATAANNTSRLNEAIKDAYNYDHALKQSKSTPLPGGGVLTGSLAVYIPTGTYLIDDTIKAHTDTDTKTNNFDQPNNHITIVGSTTSSSRPKLKLIQLSNGFDDPDAPKNMVEFRNGDLDGSGRIYVPSEPPGNTKTTEIASESYHQMLRGIDLECNSYDTGFNNGCIALYFQAAQNSSIENVSINATGAHTGLKGTPGAAGGVYNVAITGGDYGIDTNGDLGTDSSRPGVVLAGITLKKQKKHAVLHDGVAPLTITGFEISTEDYPANAALTIQTGISRANYAAINLIDGVIRLAGEPTVAAIDNTAGKNFYARNVYVTQTGNTSTAKLIKSGGNATVTGTGARRLINEYSYTMPSVDVESRVSQNLIDGIVNTAEYPTITNNAPVVPLDIVTRHVWAKLPSVDDSDAYNVSSGGVHPGPVSAAVLQGIIDANPKVFLPKGIYQLDGTITLRPNTILFGAGRALTRIEVNPTWNPPGETPIITTDDSASATTYLGNLSIGVDVANLANDYFNALHWKAGGSSMVHIGQVYRSGSNINRWTTQPHSLIRITNNGGGRWYFTGAIKTMTSQDTNANNLYAGAFRILKVEDQTQPSQPLWFYALNPEHPRGVDTYMEFINAKNVRIYGLKSEFNGDEEYEDKSSVLKFINSDNVALFGHSSLRRGLYNSKGAIEFIDTTNALATLIAPQVNGNNIPNARTVKESISGVVKKINYPNVVTVYKRGTINDTAMTHTNPSY